MTGVQTCALPISFLIDLAGGIYQEGVDRFQVVGFESHGYLAYVISDMDPQENMQLAVSLAPAVREYLAALDEAEIEKSIPKNISLTDPAAHWSAAGGPAFYVYSTRANEDAPLRDRSACRGSRRQWAEPCRRRAASRRGLEFAVSATTCHSHAQRNYVGNDWFLT